MIELSKFAQVSVGSIYLRFANKEELLKAVYERVLARTKAQHLALIERSTQHATSAGDLVRRLVDDLAEALWTHSEVMHSLLLGSRTNLTLRVAARSNHSVIKTTFCKALLTRTAEFSHPNPVAAADFTFQLCYGTVGQHLGSGEPRPKFAPDWLELKDNLKAVCTAFLLGYGARRSDAAALTDSAP